MNIQINGWFGRFGNNLIQIQNATQFAIVNNCNIIIPGHKLLNTTYIIIDKNIKKTDPIQMKSRFFGKGNFGKVDDIEDKVKIIHIVRSIFKYNILPEKIIENNEKTLVIHLRGGDIFSKKPHKGYVMPPMTYYERIIDENTFEKIILVTTDNKNPCVLSLVDKYKEKIVIQRGSLIEDMSIILNAKNVAESFGTFTHALLSLSENIQNIYKPSYQIPTLYEKHNIEKEFNINIFSYDFSQYRNLIRVWKNTPEQRKLMVEYKKN